jgi:hypothetical protein
MARQQYTVGVFGRAPFGSEVQLPPVVPGGARYSVDFVIVVIDPAGTLVGFTPVELQTIDTTGNYRSSMAALINGRTIQQSGVGLNWENVNKRILPQIIVKGLMLQAERLCASGMFFVTPKPVYDRIMARLGGPDRLRQLPLQPGATTFWTYEYAAPPQLGQTAPLQVLPRRTVSTSDLSLAFVTPENLPPAGAYESSIVSRL